MASSQGVFCSDRMRRSARLLASAAAATPAQAPSPEACGRLPHLEDIALSPVDRDGYCFGLVDLSTHRGEPLGEVCEGIGRPLEVRRIPCAAADGREIPVYLTLPRGQARRHPPRIVLPHGGPAVRDTAGFD